MVWAVIDTIHMHENGCTSVSPWHHSTQILHIGPWWKPWMETKMRGQCSVEHCSALAKLCLMYTLVLHAPTIHFIRACMHLSFTSRKVLTVDIAHLYKVLFFSRALIHRGNFSVFLRDLWDKVIFLHADTHNCSAALVFCHSNGWWKIS